MHQTQRDRGFGFRLEKLEAVKGRGGIEMIHSTEIITFRLSASSYYHFFIPFLNPHCYFVSQNGVDAIRMGTRAQRKKKQDAASMSYHRFLLVSINRYWEKNKETKSHNRRFFLTLIYLLHSDQYISHLISISIILINFNFNLILF